MPSRSSSWPISPAQTRNSALLWKLPPPACGLQVASTVSTLTSSTSAGELEIYRGGLMLNQLHDVSKESSAAWAFQVERISKEDRERFMKYESSDVMLYVRLVEQAVREQGRTSKAFKLARFINPLFETMNLYVPMARTLIQANPNPSALVLGGITCLMSISSRFKDYQEKMATILSEMLEELSLLRRYGASIYKNNLGVQQRLMEVYGDIMQFCSEATKYFLDENGNPRNSSSFRIFISSLRQSVEQKFKPTIYKFNRDLKKFRDEADFCDRQRWEADRALQLWSMGRHDGLLIHNLSTSYQIRENLAVLGQNVNSQKQLEQPQNQRAEPSAAKVESRRKLLQWLPSTPFEEDQEDKLRKHLEGTGQWLLDNKTFQGWRTKSESELLWVHGKHSCGKSYLAARVIQDLCKSLESDNECKREAKEMTSLAYVYCSSLEEAKVDPRRIVGSILKQLQGQMPNFEIEPSLENTFNRQSRPTLQVMQESIKTIMAKFSKTFLIVDGLDECRELQDVSFRGLCEFLSSLIQHNTPNSVIKVLIFSRPRYKFIEKAFQICPQIQVDNCGNDEDIKRFIEEKLSGDDLYVSKHLGLREEVEQNLLSGADGVFLWVDFLINSLKGERTRKDIRRALGKAPQTLYGVYELSMKQILSQKQDSIRTRSLKILLWITNAKRALSQSELLEALAIDPEMKELDDESQIPDDVGFTSDCRDLIICTNGFYHLIHSSLKDYLTNLSAPETDPLHEYQIMQSNAATILSETCLTYLMFNAFKDGPGESIEHITELQKKHPFLKYATIYWGVHVAETTEKSVWELAKNLLYSDGPRELSMQLRMQQLNKNVCPYPGKTTPLHLLCIFNLVDLTKSLPGMRALENEHDGFFYLPLDHAMTNMSREMCSWLLEAPDYATGTRKTVQCSIMPIHAAALNNWGDIIRRLIALGYSPNEKAGDRQETPLHVASRSGSELSVAALLEENVDVNAFDSDGQTPLTGAAESNHPQLIAKLLEAGAEADFRGRNGATALHHVARHGNAEVAKKLLRKGADPNALGREGWILRAPIHVAAEWNSWDVLALLIEEHADIEKVGPGGFNALLFASSSGSLRCVELLLKAGARIDSRNSRMMTAFHLAASNGHQAILKTLLDKKPGTELINSYDEHGDTPLHCAIRSGNKAEASLLLEYGVDANKPDKRDNSPLDIAIIQGDLETADLLVTRHQAEFGTSALHCAAYHGRCDFIPLLLKAGADPNAADSDLETTLHSAARANRLEFIKQLIKSFPKLNLAPESKYGTPLHAASSAGYYDVVQLLLQHSLQTKDLNSDLPLHLASWNGHLEVVELLLTQENINNPGFLNRTPLLYASERGHSSLVKLLLDKGADPNILDENQQSPLLASLENRYVDTGNLLLDNMADPKIMNNFGITALHHAARIGNDKLVRKLLTRGCDGLYASKWGYTPFMCAVESRKIGIVDAILEHGFNGTIQATDTGKTCVHIAAATGSVLMLQKLIAGKEGLATVVDKMGNDPLNYAAYSGQIEMIEPLKELGIVVNGLGKGMWRPIDLAASAGFYAFVHNLIEQGADINEKAPAFERTPLLSATAGRRPLIAERLLKAGANPTDQDIFGLSSLDYAYRDPEVWAKMGDVRRKYKKKNLSSRMPILRKAIQNSIRIILDQPAKEDLKYVGDRLYALEVLGDSLIAIGTGSGLEGGRICYTEMASPPEFLGFACPWTCAICSRQFPSGARYKCLQCAREWLCNACYPHYIEGGDTPRSAPLGLKSLQNLETELKPIRQMGGIFLGLSSDGFGIARSLGAKFMHNCFNRVKAVSEWVDEKLKEYGDWREAYNTSGQFDSYEKPGEMFVKLVRKASEAYGKMNEYGEGDEDDPFGLAQELFELYHQHKPEKELRRFICSNHDYLEIPDQSAMSAAEKEPFDSAGRITDEWLRNLLDIYTDDHVEQTAQDSTAKNLVLEQDSLVDHRSILPGQDINHEETAIERSAILTENLTGELAEMPDATREGFSEAIEQHTTTSNRREDQAIVEQTSERISVSGKVEEGHHSRSLFSDEEPPRKPETLQNIREELKDTMAQLVRERKRLHDITRDETLLSQASHPKAQENHDLVAGDQGEARCRLHSVGNGETNTAQKGNSESEPSIEVLRMTNMLQLVECEVAWDLAQIILVGSAKDNLMAEVLLEEDVKDEKGLLIVMESLINDSDSAQYLATNCNINNLL